MLSLAYTFCFSCEGVLYSMCHNIQGLIFPPTLFNSAVVIFFPSVHLRRKKVTVNTRRVMMRLKKKLK